MLNAGERLYRILTFQLFILLLTMMAIYASSIGKDRTPAYYSLSNIRHAMIRSAPAEAEDGREFGLVRETYLSFNLTYDLSNIYLFTTKQLFIGVIAESTQNGELQEEIVWDIVVQNSDQFGKTLNQTVQSKYPLRQIEDRPISGTYTFKLFVEEMPYGGWYHRWYYDFNQSLTIE